MKSNTSKDTIHNICTAARAEFSRQGFGDARLENVARAAGVSKQLIYHYFQSKDQLYGLILEQAANDAQSYIKDEAFEGLLPDAVVRLFIEQTIRAFTDMPFIAAMTLDEWLHNGRHVSRKNSYVALVRGFITKRLAPALADGAEAGMFRHDVDPERFYWTVFSICTAPFLNTAFMPYGTDPEVTAEEQFRSWVDYALDFIMASLRPRSDAVRS